MTDKEIIGNLYAENLELKSKLSTHEIDDIFRPQLSDEGVIAKALKILGFNWVARDRNGCLYSYKNKPQKREKMTGWMNLANAYYMHVVSMNPSQAPFLNITWEDEEPTSLDDLLKEVANNG